MLSVQLIAAMRDLPIQGMIVRQRHTIDPGDRQRLQRVRAGVEVKHLGRAAPGRADVRDHALQVDPGQIGRPQIGGQVAPGVGRPIARDRLVDQPPEHDIAGERQTYRCRLRIHHCSPLNTRR
jgi:hypothetical protein